MTKIQQCVSLCDLNEFLPNLLTKKLNELRNSMRMNGAKGFLAGWVVTVIFGLLFGAIVGKVDGYVLAKLVSKVRYESRSYYYPWGLKLEHWIGVIDADLGEDYLPASKEFKDLWTKIAKGSDEEFDAAAEKLFEEGDSDSALGEEFRNLGGVVAEECWQGIGMWESQGCRDSKIGFVGAWIIIVGFAVAALYPIIWIIVSSFRFVFYKKSDNLG